jgi:hypothetical protein
LLSEIARNRRAKFTAKRLIGRWEAAGSWVGLTDDAEETRELITEVRTPAL